MGTLEKNINFGTVNSEYLSYEYAVKDFGLGINSKFILATTSQPFNGFS